MSCRFFTLKDKNRSTINVNSILVFRINAVDRINALTITFKHSNTPHSFFYNSISEVFQDEKSLQHIGALKQEDL